MVFAGFRKQRKTCLKRSKIISTVVVSISHPLCLATELPVLLVVIKQLPVVAF